MISAYFLTYEETWGSEGDSFVTCTSSHTGNYCTNPNCCIVIRGYLRLSVVIELVKLQAKESLLHTGRHVRLGRHEYEAGRAVGMPPACGKPG